MRLLRMLVLPVKKLCFEDGFVRRALTLTSSSTVIEETFAALCAALVTPGSNGENREKNHGISVGMVEKLEGNAG